MLKRRSTLLGKQVNIFTTNVDMAFEHALELLEIDTNDGFAGKIQPRLDLGEYGTLRFRQGARFEYRSEIPTFNLVKIHGSAGWRRQGDEIYFDHSLDVIKAVHSKYEAAKGTLLEIKAPSDVDALVLGLSATGRALDQAGLDFAEAYKDLQIVNPEKTKFASTVLNKTYYELIRRFANELEKENSVLLTHGFSFRDEHLLDLVLRTASTNPTLQVIIFCYDRASYHAIKSLFPSEKVKNGNVLFVRPAEPKADEEERKLSLDVVVEDFLELLLDETSRPVDHIIEFRLGSDEHA
nr:SIR2 family protein [Paenarthrobacter aurescens]